MATWYIKGKDKRTAMVYEMIGDIEITWPKIPNRTTIDGHGLKKEEQFFRRTKLPSTFGKLNRDLEGNIKYTHDQQQFINREFGRLLDGYWFYNEGIPMYVTGSHYFELCYFQIDIGFKEYRDRDRRVHLHWKHCVDNDACYGQAYLKHRRDGATYRANSVNYLTAITQRNVQTGIQSKTGEDAGKVFRKLVQSWRRLPSFLQPIFEGNTSPKTALRFSEPSERVTKYNRSVKSSAALDSEITFKPTNPEAFDGTKLAFYHYDECGKISDIDCNDTWAIVMQCLTLGSKIVGKAMLTTTVAEMEKKGGKYFKKLYLQSDPTKRNEYGRTLSGLFKLFIPAYDGMENFIDKYGMSRLEEAKSFIQSRRDQYRKEGDQVGLQEYKRLYPFTEKEALTGATNQCEFDIEKIDDQIGYIDGLPASEKPFITGNFEWVGAMRDSKVTFRPAKNGKFKLAWQPKNESEMNKVVITGDRNDQDFEGSESTRTRNIYRPAATEKFVVSCDPFDHNVVKTGVGSKGALYVYKKFDLMEEDESRNDCFIVEYLHRPATAKIFYEEAVKICMYFGAQMLYETQKPGIRNYFEDRGYHQFLMRTPKRPDGQVRKQAKTEEIGQAASKNITQQITEYWQEYIYHSCEKIYFVDLLEDLKSFDPSDTEKNDATMGSGYGLIAANRPGKSITNQVVLTDLIPRYDNSGSASKLIVNA